MIRVKYGAASGLNEPIAWKFILVAKKLVFRRITAPHFPMYIKPRNFAKRQCTLQWFTPYTEPSTTQAYLGDLFQLSEKDGQARSFEHRDGDPDPWYIHDSELR